MKTQAMMKEGDFGQRACPTTTSALSHPPTTKVKPEVIHESQTVRNPSELASSKERDIEDRLSGEQDRHAVFMDVRHGESPAASRCVSRAAQLVYGSVPAVCEDIGASVQRGGAVEGEMMPFDASYLLQRPVSSVET